MCQDFAQYNHTHVHEDLCTSTKPHLFSILLLSFPTPTQSHSMLKLMMHLFSSAADTKLDPSTSSTQTAWAADKSAMTELSEWPENSRNSVAFSSIGFNSSFITDWLKARIDMPSITVPFVRRVSQASELLLQPLQRYANHQMYTMLQLYGMEFDPKRPFGPDEKMWKIVPCRVFQCVAPTGYRPWFQSSTTCIIKGGCNCLRR